METSWSVRLTEENILLLSQGKTIEKILHAGVLRVTQDPEGGWDLIFVPEQRG